jgi:invasion protein IalB
VTSFVSRAAAALCLAGIALSAPAFAQQEQAPAQPAQPTQAAQPDRVLKETHGAWEIHCIEGSETCIMQHIGKTANGERALLVTIERLAGVTAEGKPVPASLTVYTPLGVLIPYDVRVKIDDGGVMPVPLMRCLADLCMARAPMAEQDVSIFKKGSSARFGFYLNDEVLVDVPLNGFTAAYDSLTPVQVQAPPQN